MRRFEHFTNLASVNSSHVLRVQSLKCVISFLLFWGLWISWLCLRFSRVSKHRCICPLIRAIISVLIDTAYCRIFSSIRPKSSSYRGWYVFFFWILLRPTLNKLKSLIAKSALNSYLGMKVNFSENSIVGLNGSKSGFSTGTRRPSHCPNSCWDN